jgi:molybdopterin converting factor small subunit
MTVAKKVRIVPITGANEPVELDLPENMSAGEAIAQAFPSVKDVVIQDQGSRAMSPSTKLKDASEIRFMPMTTGGL